MTISRILTTAVATSIGLSVAVSLADANETPKATLEIRAMQTRAFDITDEIKALRSVISTLQDFEFYIGEADKVLGLVSARTYTDSLYTNWLKMTVTVRPKGETQVLVRANMHYIGKRVEDPSAYQKFFSHLEKSMFLTAHEVD